MLATNIIIVNKRIILEVLESFDVDFKIHLWKMFVIFCSLKLDVGVESKLQNRVKSTSDSIC
jgi:hypothetical protein